MGRKVGESVMAGDIPVNKKQLRILHVLSQRPDSTGSGIYLQAMIQEATSSGDSSFLVAGLNDSKPDAALNISSDNTRYVNFDTSELPYRIPGMSDVMPYESTRFRDMTETDHDAYQSVFSRTIKHAADQFKPDVIHSHHLWLVSSLARRLIPDIPMITSCHGSDLRQFQNCEHLQHRVLMGCRNIDRVMALSQAQKEEITRLYNISPAKIAVSGAGYNDRLFYSQTKPNGPPVKIVYAGKLSKAKGVPWLLRALKNIGTPAWQLHLLGGGSGDEKELCLKLAAGLGDQVIVHGAVPQVKLAQVMRDSHILVLPSFFEGLPLVVLEGLASGCRIVATDLPGTRELLGDLGPEFVSLVEPPRLRCIDMPLEEDEALFENRLQHALTKQLTGAIEATLVDSPQIRNKLNRYTWNGVFKTIRQQMVSCLH